MQTVKTKNFDYGTEEVDYLKSADALLGAAMERIGRVERVVIPDLFAALVFSIVSQMISEKAAHTIKDRMMDRFGEITPDNLAQQSAEDIQRCGMTTKKAACIMNIARSIQAGTLDLNEFHQLPDLEIIHRLSQLNGVGKWTAEMLLILSMERRDIVSWGDMAIRRGMARLYGLDTLTKEQFEENRRRYSPYGSVASIFLWKLSAE
jgi:DNA-3-methyladenine glycosylase II